MSEYIDVSKAQFYACVGPLDVHPYPERLVTYWRLTDRRVVGISTPGYVHHAADTPAESYKVAAWVSHRA
jgi:hypothetical protein